MQEQPLRLAIATTIDPLVVMPRLRALCDRLSEELARPTSGHLMISYEELERGVEGDDFHLMWLPPLIALSVIPKGAAKPLAIPVRGGQTSYATAIVVRDDSEIRSLDDLKNKTLGWVDPHSSAGYVLPRALLRAKGIDPDRDLGEPRLLGSHEAVVRAVTQKTVDAGATYVNLEEGQIAGSAWGERNLRVVAHHGPIPADVVASGRGLDEALASAVEARLVSEPTAELTELFRALLRCDAFVAPDAGHLDALAALVT